MDEERVPVEMLNFTFTSAWNEHYHHNFKTDTVTWWLWDGDLWQ